MTTSTTSSRVSQFQGIIDIPLRRLTNTFVPSDPGWLFSKNMWPIEYTAYRTFGTFLPRAVKGNVFDYNNISTYFELGDPNGLQAAAVMDVCYDSGKLRGWVTSNITAPTSFEYGFNVGTPLIVPALTTNSWPFATGGNQFPASNCLPCNVGINGRLYSSYDGSGLSVQEAYSIYLDRGGSYVQPINRFVGLGVFAVAYRGVIPYNGQNWCFCTQTAGNIRLANLWPGAEIGNDVVNFYELTWNDSTVNTILTGSTWGDNQTRPTPFGFLSVYNNMTPFVFQGRTFNGAMFLTSPDGTKWWLLNIVPQDTPSITWRSSGATANAVITPDGRLWYHPTNQNSSIYVSDLLNLSLYQLPVFPPIALPSPPDENDVAMMPYRDNTRSGEL